MKKIVAWVIFIVSVLMAFAFIAGGDEMGGLLIWISVGAVSGYYLRKELGKLYWRVGKAVHTLAKSERPGNAMSKDKKEGLKEILTRPPSVPTIPIGRKEFFFGFLIIAVTGFLLNTGFALLLGELNVFIAGVITVIASYVTATWSAKRFLDIRPEISAKLSQIVLFPLFLGLTVLTYIQINLMNEIATALAAGALNFPISTLRTVSVLRVTLGIPLFVFTLVLLSKKGHKAKTLDIKRSS